MSSKPPDAGKIPFIVPGYAVEELDEVVEATRPLWERLRGGRLLITGATGFFGSWLVQTFARANARLSLDARAVVLARRAGVLRGLDPAVEPFEGDVRGPRLPEGPFSHVIHGATSASASLNDQQPLDKTIVAEFACIQSDQSQR